MTYRLDDYTADALGMIEAVALGRPVILGHSMGARIAIRLAATHPGSTTALILADPPLTGPGRRPYPTPLESYLTAHAAASRGATIDEFRLLNPTWSDEQIALRLEWLPTCDVEAIAQTYAYFHSEDIHTDIANIACPALLIRAANAHVVTPEDAAEVVTLLKNGAVEEVAAGHMIPWENLPGFLEPIERFLESRNM